MSIGSVNSADTPQLAYDVQGLDQLKLEAQRDPKAAARKVASEFEAMFLQTLLKTMRETRFDDEEDSNAMDTYRGMADQQLATSLSKGRGTGLGDALYQQILRASNLKDEAGTPLAGSREIPLGTLPKAARQAYEAAARDGSAIDAAKQAQSAAVGADLPVAPSVSKAQPVGRDDFVGAIAPHAQAAASSLGVAPHLVVAHAALESGWGKRSIRNADGSNSHNLFGIKATGNWQGKTTDVVTTEYENGVAQKRVERFRSYANYAEAFADYAKLLRDNPRYQGALGTGNDASAFARGIARGGYATDPNYASKLAQVAASAARG